MAAALVAATIAGGCTRSRATTRRPFSDVTDPQRNEATIAVEPGEGAAPDLADAQVQVTDDSTTTITTTTQTPVNGNSGATLPPAEQPTIVPPTETIRAETPRAAGPATTAIQGSPSRYQIVAPTPSIVPTTRPANGTASAMGNGAEIPLEVDEVGLVRQWPVWVGERPSGNVVAGPTYWPTISREPRRTELSQAFVEPVEFLWNTLLLPYRAIRTPPGTRITYDPARPQDEPRAPYEINAAQQEQQQQQQ
jgi:hypothetical protein